MWRPIEILRDAEGGSGGSVDGSASPGDASAGGTPAPAGPSSGAPDGGLKDGAPDASSAIPSEIMGGMDLDEVVLPEEPSEPEAPKEPADLKPGEAKPGEAAKPKEAEAAKPGEEKPKVEEKPTQKQETTASPAPATADILEQLAANKKDIIAHLAGERFALTQEESDQLDVNPTQAIPRIAARVFYESQVATINQIAAMVPRIVAAVQDSTSTAKEAEKGFYDANKDLNSEAHGAIVGQFAKMFRSANPSASKEDAYKFVASAVRAHVGLIAPTPAVPAARPKGPAPFTPARGGAKVVATNQVDENPFAGMGMDFDDS